MSVRGLPTDPDALLIGAGGLLTVYLATSVALNGGLSPAPLAILAAAAALAVVAAFIRIPHWAIALAIPVFALIPTLKWFVWPWSGGAKDLIAVAAAAAAVVVALRRHQAGQATWVDPLVLGSVLVFGALYLVDAGGSHGPAWLDSARIALGPLLLLLAPMALDDPRRNLRWTVGSLAITATPIAVYGLLQQALGPQRLVDLGYSYAQQVRTVSGELRSFGTFDDAFAYSSFLLLAAAVALAWYRPRAGVLAWATMIAVGAAAGLVRTAALVAVVVGVALLVRSRRRLLAAGTVVGLVAVLIAVVAVAGPNSSLSDDTDAQSRTSIWAEAIGPPGDWLAGRGAGEIGTAAERQEIGVIRDTSDPAAGQADASAIDSGYVATIADVGLLGLLVLLVLLGRLAFLAYAGIRRDDRAGWVAMLALLALCIDAVTRASFTSFPTAYVAFLVIGAALAAMGQGGGGGATRNRRADPGANTFTPQARASEGREEPPPLS